MHLALGRLIAIVPVSWTMPLLGNAGAQVTRELTRTWPAEYLP
ncbi:hypothetical protein ABZ894_17455 [Nocardia beijingensis]